MFLFKKMWQLIYLCTFTLLIVSCSKGPYEIDDKLWVDLEPVAGGGDGYLTGFYQGVEEGNIIIKIEKVEGAEENPLAIKASAAVGQDLLIPQSLVKTVAEGRKAYERRKQLEVDVLTLFKGMQWQETLAEDVKKLKARVVDKNGNTFEALMYLEGVADLYAVSSASKTTLEKIQANTALFRDTLKVLDENEFGRSYDLLADVFLKYYLKQRRMIMKIQAIRDELKQMQALHAAPEEMAQTQDNLADAQSEFDAHLVELKSRLQQGILEGDIGEGFDLRDRVLALITILNMFEVNSEEYYRAIFAVVADPAAAEDDKMSVMAAMVRQAEVLADILTKKGTIDLAANQGRDVIFNTSLQPLFLPFKEQIEVGLQLHTMKTTEDAEAMYLKAVAATAEYSSRFKVDIYTEADKQRFMNMLDLYR